MSFTSVEGWTEGDNLVDFRGDPAKLIRVTRPNEANRSAKVLVTVDAGPGCAEFYADVFTNTSHEYRLLTAAAIKLGAEAGEAAASWFETDEWEVVLEGIEAGDPEVLDAFPYADLSGQWADGPTAAGVARDIFNEAGVEMGEDDPTEEGWGDLVDAWMLAFDEAVSLSIENRARVQLGLEVVEA